jgi:hypothetical protein
VSHKHAKKIRQQLRAQGEDPRQVVLVKTKTPKAFGSTLRVVHHDSGRKLYQWAKTQ